MSDNDIRPQMQKEKKTYKNERYYHENNPK
jgi:hypothetical protein